MAIWQAISAGNYRLPSGSTTISESVDIAATYIIPETASNATINLKGTTGDSFIFEKNLVPCTLVLGDNSLELYWSDDKQHITINFANGIGKSSFYFGDGTLNLTKANDVISFGTITQPANSSTSRKISDLTLEANTKSASYFAGKLKLTLTVPSLINNDPVAHDDVYQVSYGDGHATLSVLDNDIDLDTKDVLTITNVSQTTNSAKVSVSNGKIEYNYADLFSYLAIEQSATDSFNYTIQDSYGSSSTTTVFLTITRFNSLPVAGNDLITVDTTSTTAAGALSIPIADLLANDTDADTDDTKGIVSVDTKSAAGISMTQSGATIIYAAGTRFQALGEGQVFTDTFTYTMKDSIGAKSTATVTIKATGENDSPVLQIPIEDQSILRGKAFELTIPVGTFTDVDANDQLRYSAKLANGNALPDWLTFDSDNRIFSGTPENTDISDLVIVLTAEDTSGATTSDNFSLTVSNKSPVLKSPLKAQSATQDKPFSYNVAENTFSDPDVGDTLSYTATLSNGSALPSWLSFSDTTRTFSGTPDNAAVGSLNIRVTASDAGKQSTYSDFSLSVANVNDAPIVNQSITDQNLKEGSSFNFVIPSNTFLDVDLNDSLSLTATQSNGKSLPKWLKFNAQLNQFSGTPSNADTGTLSIKVSATDKKKASVSDTFDLKIQNVNQGPFVEKSLKAQKATENKLFTYTFDAKTFSDPDLNEVLSYTATLNDGSALPSWLSFNSQARTFTGTPSNSSVGTLAVRVTATDTSQETAYSDFSLAIANINNTPILATPIADQTVKERAIFSFTLPTGTFADIDAGDSLTYSATLENGKALPAWLKFNTTTQTFLGTPSATDAGTLNISVNAVDKAKTKINDTFKLDIENVNALPALVKPLKDQKLTEGKAFSFTLPNGTFADTDKGDGLTTSVANLPDWLKFDSASGKLSGTPSYASPSETTITFIATDKLGGTANAELLMNIGNIGKITGTKLADQIQAGDGNDSISGADGNDLLGGGNDSDTINGGLGTDTLMGGSGTDNFIFNTKLSSANIDTITDFTPGTDKLVLAGSIFGKIKGDKDLSDNLVNGTTASTVKTYLVFNGSDHTLYYDADGSGAKSAPIAVCVLTGISSLAISDIGLT